MHLTAPHLAGSPAKQAPEGSLADTAPEGFVNNEDTAPEGSVNDEDIGSDGLVNGTYPGEAFSTDLSTEAAGKGILNRRCIATVAAALPHSSPYTAQ